MSFCFVSVSSRLHMLWARYQYSSSISHMERPHYSHHQRSFFQAELEGFGNGKTHPLIDHTASLPKKKTLFQGTHLAPFNYIKLHFPIHLMETCEMSYLYFYACISFIISNVILIISKKKCLNIPNNGPCNFKY